jgi:hypothetical protein
MDGILNVLVEARTPVELDLYETAHRNASQGRSGRYIGTTESKSGQVNGHGE